jgi:phenylalanyl-tRNA synthetase beta chain
MLISHDWLRAIVPHDRTPEQIRDLLSAHVATVDRMQRLREDLRDVVVGRVVQAGRHPNADTLWVTKVDDGSGELLDVVCGAPVVTVGTLYPFARAGITLPGGIKLEKRKIRGEISNGMLCSARELGLGADHSGIMALDIDVAPGTPFLEAVSVADVQFEVDVLPNRPDLLSHAGVAREVAALTGVAAGDPPEVASVRVKVAAPVRGDREASSAGVTVRIEDAEGCPRYMGVVIRGVKVGPSPDWLVRRLESIGLRSISNVVDATNYMLHGYGQPMHAFDLSRIAERTIVVRRANAGDRMVTLDGVDRALDPGMTMIADARVSVAVGGVMGGRDSEVGAATSDIFLEVANFDPSRIRATRKRLGMSTDASYRFERGIDEGGMLPSLEIAAGLIVHVAGGTVDGAPIIVGTERAERSPVVARPERLERLLGDRVPAAEISKLLSSVGFSCEARGDGTIAVVPPTWRHDVTRDADLVEEIARLRGYDRLSDELSPFRPGTVPDHPLHVVGRRLSDALVGDGLSEVKPLPFVRGDDETHVRVANPLAEDEPHYRRSLLETLAKRAEYNLSRMQGDVRLFEIGSALAPSGGDLPAETIRVGALIMGRRRPPHFTEPDPPAFDAWDAKALGERIATVAFPGEPVSMEPAGDGRSWAVVVGAVRRHAGTAGPVPLDRPPWAAEAFGVEVTLDTMPNGFLAAQGQHAYDVRPAPVHRLWPRYTPIPTMPAADVDLALLVPDGVLAADVERVMRASGGDLLENVELFDEYRGSELPSGVRSLAWRLTFRDPVRTLRDKEIEGRRQKVLRSLESELGVRSRITA